MPQGQDRGKYHTLGIRLGHLIKALWKAYLIFDLKKENIEGDRTDNNDLCKECNMYKLFFMEESVDCW